VWYRFGFKLSNDWPHDVPAAGRQPCRTVIHQIKQDALANGESCGASPFFKVEARPLGNSVRFFAQIAWGDACASPPHVKRKQICATDDVPRETWTTVNVRLRPAHDESGRVDVWLDGKLCGSYSGPMVDPEHGARRNGVPFINAQPRFGIYRDWRAEMQLKADRATGAGELVKFGETLWYRFSFKVPGDWPRDVPIAGREPCRTVIHQVKQNASKDGKDCGASPFFKIEARPLGDHVRFFAQLAAGDSCAWPPAVTRTKICVNDLPRESWTTVNVRIFPAQDASSRVDLWLNGAHCGSYRGAMGDPEHGARRNGAPFVDTQPRFGIYRDWRAETQTIYFDKIVFWNAEPTGHPDWGADPTPQ